MNSQRAKDRIEGRKFAEELLTFIPADSSEEFMEAFAKRLLCFVETIVLSNETTLMVMNDKAAERFENCHRIMYGKHKGKKYIEVPIEYLTWIADSNSQLQAYLRSKRGTKRIENEVPQC